MSTADIRALLRFISYDCGYPAATAGFERLVEFETAAGLSRPEVEPLADNLLETGPGTGTLTERERGFASMNIDVHYQTLEETFQAHIGRALRGGASDDDVRAALRFKAQVGVTRAWRTWKALNAYLAELNPTG